nr:hypothetical protein [Paraburkholderia sp. MMS20-SJTR3]
MACGEAFSEYGTMTGRVHSMAGQREVNAPLLHQHIGFGAMLGAQRQEQFVQMPGESLMVSSTTTPPERIMEEP